MKWLKKWFSFKKENPSDLAAEENKDEINATKRDRNNKRVSDAIPKEHLKKKIPKTTRKEFPTQGDEYTDEEDTKKKENKEESTMSEYELKTISEIEKIQDNCKKFEDKIDSFQDISGSQIFFFIDGSLQKSIDNLDQIEAVGSTKIREARKNAVKYINSLTDKLEARAKNNEDQLKPMEFRLPPISRQQFLEGKKEEEL